MRDVLTTVFAATASGLAQKQTSPLTDYVSIGIAALAFGVSCVLGLLNRRTARRALALSERQEARRDSRLDLYLVGSVDQRQPDHADRVLAFHVLLSNPADRATAIVDAELHVTYTIEGVVMTVKIRSGAEATVHPTTPGIDPLELPLRIEANDAQSGWLVFGLSGDLMRGFPIDRYDLVVRDVHGIEESLQVRVVYETVDV